jgi:dTDP-4-dehydrorhamnose 3,5-epimerase
MDVSTLEIAGLVCVTPPRLGDARGTFSETYSKCAFAAAIGEVEFVQDNHSWSARRGTVRGLHFQLSPFAQAKLVRVGRGAILDVAVDIREGSPTYGRHVKVELSAANGRQLFVPAGFAHGFCTLEDDTDVLYKVSAHYSPEHDRAISWRDPDLGIAWPVTAEEATVSSRDAQAPRLSGLSPPFRGWS